MPTKCQGLHTDYFLVYILNSFMGKANLWYTAKYMFPGNVFVKQSSEFDKQEGFSSEKCVVDYENAVYSGLTKWLLYSSYGAILRCCPWKS